MKTLARQLYDWAKTDETDYSRLEFQRLHDETPGRVLFRKADRTLGLQDFGWAIRKLDG